MKVFNFEDFITENAVITRHSDHCVITYSKAGGKAISSTLFQNLDPEDKFLCFDIESTIERSQNILFEFWTGGEACSFSIRMGLLPHLRTTLAIPFEAFDGTQVFLKRTPGRLKTVVTGTRLDVKDITQFSMSLKISILKEDTIEKSFKIYKVYTSSEEPDYEIPSIPMVDEFGQWSLRDWKGKIHTEQELLASHSEASEEAAASSIATDFPYSRFGGWLNKRFDATGFFRVQKEENGRTWLVDPDGYVFISNGAANTLCQLPSALDGIEALYEKLPEEERFYTTITGSVNPVANGRYVDFLKSNLYRIYGDDYYREWQKHTARRLKRLGINSAGNWSDLTFCKEMKIPYFIPMKHFPATPVNIFRDFPDVYSAEYQESAKEFAKQLLPYRDDPYMIGYFMSNEPAWTWAPNLNLAEEMYVADVPFESRTVFADYLREKYITIDALNEAWGSRFPDFESFLNPIPEIASYHNEEDMRTFSKRMMDEYIRVPALAIREVDPNHLNLGQRYAAPLPDRMLAGSDYIDVLSFNCYRMSAVDPLRELAKYTDKPCIIGEFHFGAFDRGMSMTGLISVASQEERGVAYRYYMEMSAKEPNFVGANYFTLYDQAYLGRFDGENYQIGICDICDNEYEEFAAAIKETSKVLYEVADGKREAYSRVPNLIAR